MLENLRKMSPEAKKKVVILCASVLTLVVAGTWGMYSYGVFASAFDGAKSQGVAVFSFLEQNVERAYNSFQETAQQNIASATMTEATSSEAQATTTEEISPDELLMGETE